MTGPMFKLREGAVAWQEIDGEAILLDLEASMYLGANPAGSVLWSALAEGTSRDSMIERLRTRFDVSEDRAGRDVDDFLSLCDERGYLES